MAEAKVRLDEMTWRAAETLAPAFDHLADYLRHLQEHPRKFVE